MNLMESQKLDSAICIRLKSETVEAVKKKAKKARRTTAEYIRIVIEDHAQEK